MLCIHAQHMAIYRYVCKHEDGKCLNIGLYVNVQLHISGNGEHMFSTMSLQLYVYVHLDCRYMYKVGES